jgi:hypothetical protein
MNDNDIERWHYGRTHVGRDIDDDYRDEDEEVISEDYIDYVETYLEDR